MTCPSCLVSAKDGVYLLLCELIICASPLLLLPLRSINHCGGRHPGYPHGGSIRSLGQRVGRADHSRWDTLGLLAAQDFMKLLSDRDRIRPTLYRGGTVVTD